MKNATLSGAAPPKTRLASNGSKEVVAKKSKVAKEVSTKKGKGVEKVKKAAVAAPAVDWGRMNAKDIISSQWLPLKKLRELADEHGEC